MMFLLVFFALFASSLAAFMRLLRLRRRERALAALYPGSSSSDAPAPGILGAPSARSLIPEASHRSNIIILVAALATLAITRSLLLASIAWPATMLARRLVNNYRRNRAATRKEEQVLEFIDSLSQSLRAGLSLRQSLEVSVEDIGEELGDDIRDILKDMRMGAGLEESLTAAAGNSSSASLRLTFSVLGLLHGRGGDLPRVLERLRKRVAGGLDARREARILTSQSRASGYLVSSLPAVFLLLQAALNPRSLNPLFATSTGNIIIAVALAMNAAAFLLIRRMVDQEV
jgi:tight adherence protein B